MKCFTPILGCFLGLVFATTSLTTAQAVEPIESSSIDPAGGKIRVDNAQKSYFVAHCTERRAEDGECLKAQIVSCFSEEDNYCSVYDRSYGSPDRLRAENRRALRSGAWASTFRPAPYLSAANLILVVAAAIGEKQGTALAILATLPLCLAADIVAMPFEALFTGPSYLKQRTMLIRQLTFMLDGSAEGETQVVKRSRFESLTETLKKMDKLP